MDLRHLQYFTAVAEEQHFGRAAKRLNIAQPPLSRQIQALEAELGFQLFDRSRRRVELTAAGAVLLQHSKRVFEAVEQAVKDAKRASMGETGRVAIGYLSSLAYSGIVELLRAFRTKSPAIDISLREMPPQTQVDAIKEGTLDVGFVRAPLNDPALDQEVVRREPLVVALPKGHPFASKARIALECLRAEPFVTFPRHRGPSFYDQIQGLCRTAGFIPNVVQEAPQLDMISLVAAGFGVAIVPDSMRHIRRAGIILRPIVGSPKTELLLTWRTGDRSPALGEFIQFVRKYGVDRTDRGAKNR